jgi:anaerobic selenocysteine-containing dehydrogenase
MDLKRRTFMKALGLAAAGAVLPGCEREAHRLVPYLLPDDEIVPGVANWYASTCRECSAGCGITVRVMEGRAKKIEGNPVHPLNQGKLCAQGQAALQGLYNPDRLRGPLRRNGRGDHSPFTSMSWEDGLDLLSERLKTARGRVIMISRPLSGTLADLASTFLRSIGGELLFYDPGADLPLRTACRTLFGIDAWPHYDLGNSDYLLSFGAPFLEQWLSPVSFGIAYGHMRQGRATTRGRFVQVEPRLSLTGANADQWIPIRPGAEGLLAIGIGQVLLAEGKSKLPGGQRRLYEQVYAGISLDRLAAAADIPRDWIIRTAREFAAAAAPLAIGGGSACAHTNATDSLMAINGLNAIAGNIGRAGGLRFYKSADFPMDATIPWLTERAMQEMGGTPPSVILLYDTNPLHVVPPSIPLRRIFDQADFVASFSPFMDESTSSADLILPDHSALESWGDHVQTALSPRPAVSLAQPVVSPLYNTSALGDTILSMARRLGLKQFPWHDFHQLLRTQWRRFLTHENRKTGDEEFETAWINHLQQGGSWSTSSPDLVIAKPRPPSAHEPPLFDGDERDFPLHFFPYPSPSLGYGRGANLPWLQELPDTLTTATWGTWAEINPATARSYGIKQGDMVRIVSRHGSIEVPALYYPAIRPDVIAVPMGQGHMGYGRYASRRGANPASILAPLFDHRSGALATAATRICIETTDRPGKPVLLEPVAMQPENELLKIGKTRAAS